MFKSLQIQNYRAFDELDIKRLGHINLFTGKNNTGKTTLLEAIFLLCGAGNVQMALNAGVIRGTTSAAASLPATFWKPLFTALDMTKTVKITGVYSSLGQLTMNIKVSRPETVELPLDTPGSTSVAESLNENGLLFSFEMDSKKVESSVYVTGDEVKTKQHPDWRVPFPGMFLPSGRVSFQEDAMYLGTLRKQRQGDLLVDALQIFEPKLQNVEENSASGVSMIWVDIDGLPELVPLALLGEGATRIASLIIRILNTPKGIVLVDEVENGFHHSVLNKIWQVISAAARKVDAQIVASTHSFECVEAAQYLDSDSFLLHRLEKVDDKLRCITYEPDEIKAAIRHSLEVR